MITGVASDTTSMLIAAALNAAAAKHLAIAQNIANVNNEGFRPLSVNFDERVAFFKNQLLDSRRDSATVRVAETLREATAIVEAPGSTSGKIQLDAEVAKMVQNTVHYEALLAAHGKMSSMLHTAINGGR
jgi:flagellar basal-body rod protein FlgB